MVLESIFLWSGATQRQAFPQKDLPAGDKMWPQCPAARARPAAQVSALEASLHVRSCHAVTWCDTETSRTPLTDIRNLYVWHRRQLVTVSMTTTASTLTLRLVSKVAFWLKKLPVVAAPRL